MKCFLFALFLRFSICSIKSRHGPFLSLEQCSSNYRIGPLYWMLKLKVKLTIEKQWHQCVLQFMDGFMCNCENYSGVRISTVCIAMSETVLFFIPPVEGTRDTIEDPGWTHDVLIQISAACKTLEENSRTTVWGFVKITLNANERCFRLPASFSNCNSACNNCNSCCEKNTMSHSFNTKC